MPTGPERLAAAVKKRRAELDLSQVDVWNSGGPSNTTLTTIEGGRATTLNRTTARKLDAGLRWEPGSAKAVWEGTGEPVPVSEAGGGESLSDLRAELAEMSERLADLAERNARLAANIDRIQRSRPVRKSGETA